MNNCYSEKQTRVALASAIADEAVVLLENKGILPLKKGSLAAVFGGIQFDPVVGGGGSGASRCDNPQYLNEELKKYGLLVEPAVEETYAAIRREKMEAMASQPAFDPKSFEGLITSGAIYEIFGAYKPVPEEQIPSAEIVEKSAAGTDTAILIIGRTSGSEECDRRLENDYLLTESEQQLTDLVCAHYRHVIVVCNSVGTIDLAWVRKHENIEALLFMGAGGETGAGSLARVIMGEVSPSGKLPYTFACAYEDYPCAAHFSYNKDSNDNILTYSDYGLSAEENGSVGYDLSPVTVYQEDIYNGYRYFDTFDKPYLYGFGYGLSYTDFALSCREPQIKDGCLVLPVAVTNTGDTYAGKETVQVYVGSPSVHLEAPRKELKAFAKTKLLAPGEGQILELSVRLEDLAHFEESRNVYVIEAGVHTVYAGNSFDHTEAAVSLKVDEEIITRTVTADIGIQACNAGKIDFLHRTQPSAQIPCAYALEVKADDVHAGWPVYAGYDYSKPAEVSTLRDVYEGKVSVEAFVKQMSVEEMAVLCVGFGSGLPFSGIGVKDARMTLQYENGEDIAYNSHPTARPGFMNAAMKKYGIYSAGCTDGPAFVGDTAWPTATPLSCTFNMELLEEFGKACSYEVTQRQMDSWLAPGMNIIRNPLCGRNFEYFSEDPLLAGACGTAIAKGALSNGVTMCPKHFALNEQETYRRGSLRKNIDAVDSIVSARAAREIYLKPFEMIVTQTGITEIMTSFNKINGTFAAGNHALCTEILRGEWGFDGAVVTDWGDMDIVVDGADALAAGNDVVMPGGPPVALQILKGYEEGRVTMEELYEASVHQLNFVMSSLSFKKQMEEN